MIYIYDDLKKEYTDFVKESNGKCYSLFQCTIDELYSIHNLTEEQESFLWWYEYKMPVGNGQCAMNRICHYIENQMDGYKLQLKRNSDFDYNKLKAKRRCTDAHRTELLELEKEYCECVRQYKQKKIFDKGEKKKMREFLYHKFNSLAREICPNDNERLNIILDIAYAQGGNKQFCWDTIGELIYKRLEEDEVMNSVYTK